jgi:hypothetical protein
LSRTRARLLRSLLLLLVLAAAAGGVFAVTRFGPERGARWLEAQLEEQLGPVEIDALGIGFHWGPALEVRGIRAAPDPEGSGARLEAQSGKISFDLTRLLRGELRIGRIKLTRLHAELVRGVDGGLRPHAAQRLRELAAAARDSGEPGDAAEPFDPRAALDALRSVRTTLPALAIEEGEIRWRDARTPAGEIGARVVEASLGRTRLGGGLSLGASGRLLGDGADAGGFELRGELPPLGEPKAELILADLDLAAVQPWLDRWSAVRDAKLELAGRASAHVAWRADGPSDRIDAEGAVHDLIAAGRVGRDGRAQRAEHASARIAGSFTVTPASIDATNLELDLGPWRLRGRAQTTRPIDEQASIDFRASGEPVPTKSLRAALRAADDPALTRIAEAISGGRLAAWSLICRGLRRTDWQRAAQDPLEAWPEGCALEFGLSGVTVRTGEADPIQGLRGQVGFRRDHLTLRGVHARLDDRPLPTLDLSVTGVAAIARAIADGEVPRAVPPLPGWFTLEAWAKGDRDPRAPSRWQRAEIEASRLDHPILLRPVSGLRAVLQPVPFGFDAEIVEAYWGSAVVRGRARKSGDPPGRIEVEAHAVTSPRPAPRDPEDPAAWARAKFRVELQKLGKFRAREASGRVRIEGDQGQIRDGTVRLLPHGDLVGEVDLGLDRSDFVPATGRLRVEGASLPDLLEDLNLDREVMTGTVYLSGEVSAKLIPRENLLRELTGPVTITLRDGEIRKRMNLLLALAAASDTFNLFRSREVLPYDEIEGEGVLDRGTVRAEALSLVGPAARLVATGDVDIVDAPNPVNAVVGVFFFKTLDTVIGAVPLVNRILLGKDENLMAAYFALSGPWKQPSARILPSTLLTSGPVGIVTDGLPGFVRSGIGTLWRLLGGGAEDGKPEPPPEPASPSEARR